MNPELIFKPGDDAGDFVVDDIPEAGASVTIELRAGELPRVVSDAVSALQRVGAQIYDRGGALYRPVRVEVHDVAGGVRRALGSIMLRPVDPGWLRLQLAGAATWSRWDARAKEYKPADPPCDIAHIITDTPDAGPWPHLRAVVAHPVITPEGRIITAPGYDADTRLLLDIDGLWPIPDAPTLDMAKEACGRLCELLRFFPFVSDVDRSVALSLYLTAIARPVLPAAPLHGVDAPEPGTGKTLMIDSAATLATGTTAAVMEFGADPAEAGKRLDGMQLAGDQIIAIDNIDVPMEGAAFCQALTQATRRIRPLGASTVVTVPCTALITATGCNLTLRGDIVRRAIVCRLDARTERPELRTITQDLLAETRDRRRELVADVITIMAAYIQAGRPSVEVKPIGSYEAWSSMVRSALIWAGEADPVAAMDRTRSADPSRQAIHAVLRTWRISFGSDAITSAEAVERTAHDEALRDALGLVAERRGRLDSKALGYWLRGHRDRRAGALVLRAAPGRAGVSRWVVKPDDFAGSGDGGDGGDGGDVPTLRGRDVIDTLPYVGNEHGLSQPYQPCPRCEGDGCEWCAK